MRQLWRWFGPKDPVALSDIRQAGAEGIVTALHHIPSGVAWSRAEIRKRQNELANSGGEPVLAWEVVESLPVSEAIKTRGRDWREHLAAYRASMEALAAQGIHTICYNFMPVLDWTRTELAAPLPHGGTAMRFDQTAFAMFDLYLLGRSGAEHDYCEAVRDDAARLHAETDAAGRAALVNAVTCGLPGAAESWTLHALGDALAGYRQLPADTLRQHHVDFLSELAPLAERLDLRLCCHPDDPPWPLLGLPRVVSTAADYRQYLAAVNSPAVGMTLCTGSLGARGDNDCAAMVREFGNRLHFVHLRNVTRSADTVPCSFIEDAHLAGQTDMVAVIRAILDEEGRRRDEGRPDAEIGFRPDHGQAILGDLSAGGQPGYPAVGRLKGLAELRGVITALSHPTLGVPA